MEIKTNIHVSNIFRGSSEAGLTTQGISYDSVVLHFDTSVTNIFLSSEQAAHLSKVIGMYADNLKTDDH